ncbi:hypothetical protein O6H91_05G095400 [Diphasiastrum complanatum]|uniref:Uncharacterized protein n=1 Tax=Diphasiastrum complanatum TaxID=34168 RepID=A0ACC2DQY7_DIPCM|nr:hypothetical protein O6H91_05G095400 [Diphasiastrum complanatum]
MNRLKVGCEADMEAAVLKSSSQCEARRLSQVRLKDTEGYDLCAEEEISAGSELSVASNADSDSESDNLSGYSSEACSGSSEWRSLTIHGETYERISRTSSWKIIKEAESSKTEWTNDQHCSYLNSMEAAFVRNMFGKAYYAAEQCGERAQCTELGTVKELKSRAHQRSYSSSPYSRFGSKARSYNKKPGVNCSINVRIDKSSINVQHANCLNCVQDSQKRQLVMPEVPELESCAGQYAFINYQPTFRNGVSEKLQPDVSQGKHTSHKYQNQFSEQFSIVEKAQHGTPQDENGESDQVVPLVYGTHTRHIDEPSTVADTKSNLELKNS